MTPRFVFVAVRGVIMPFDKGNNDKLFSDNYYEGQFENKQPVNKVIDYIFETYDPSLVYPIIQVPDDNVASEINNWLNKYFNVDINRRAILGYNTDKIDFLCNFSNQFTIPFSDMIFISSESKELRQAERLGCEVHHVSEIYVK